MHKISIIISSMYTRQKSLILMLAEVFGACGLSSFSPFAGGRPVDGANPCVMLQKQISVDSGVTWLDADNTGTAATAFAPHEAS